MNKSSAFSLVELSIVLVILGLLTGGILGGQSLIRAAELRAVSTEYGRWTTAMHSFRDKYFAWPGDMTNATSFWGASSGCPATAGTGTQTCNGNGDNVISAAPAANQYGEFFTFWQHLANAGLIEGSYTGRAGSGGQGNAATTNVPASKLSSAYWFIFNWNQMRTGATDSFDGPFFDNMFQIGGLSAAGTAWTPRLKPEEAWNIDMKLDDGRPAYGIMRERYWDDCTDAATSATLSASYALTVTGTVCTPIFILK